MVVAATRDTRGGEHGRGSVRVAVSVVLEQEPGAECGAMHGHVAEGGGGGAAAASRGLRAEQFRDTAIA